MADPRERTAGIRPRDPLQGGHLMRTRPLDLVAPALVTALLIGCGASTPAPTSATASAAPTEAAPTEAAAGQPMQPEFDAAQDEGRTSTAKREEAAAVPGAAPAE